MKEKLKWFFESTKNMVAGANDPIHETFRAFPYYSIVRESLQNSLDAVLDPAQPVRVVFEIVTIKQEDWPSLFKIRDHIEACLKLHEGDIQAEALYKRMLDYLKNNPTVKLLRVADYNTKGMPFIIDDVNCPFVSFVRAEGKSAKGTGSGGSFGFGKGAYYVLSEIRTLLISTRLGNGETYFEGKTRLASHKLEGEMYGKDGFFNKEEINPVNDLSDIPAFFRRQDQGTDIWILGLLEDEDSVGQMIKSVLNNFWLAVHKNLLTVEIKVEDKEIKLSSENLDALINSYFPEEKESGSVTDIFNWNPTAYYKAVKHAGEAERFMKFEPNLEKYPTLGGVFYYLYRKEGLPNRTAYMRKPAMVVQKITNNIVSGYAGVFVCRSEEGNEMLRQMENAAHNQWKVENVRNASAEMENRCTVFKQEINRFVNDTLKSLSSVDDSTRLEVDGLADYLFIPENLIEQTEDLAGNIGNQEKGGSSREPSEEESGSQTTTNSKTKIKTRVIKSFQAPAPVTGDEDDHGEDRLTPKRKNLGNSGLGSGGSGMKNGTKGPGDSQKILIPIKYRVASIPENGNIFHYLIINSPEEVPDAEIILTAGTDNGDTVELDVLSSNQGLVNKNVLSQVHLNTGKTEIKLQFNDNIKYALNIVAYEIN